MRKFDLQQLFPRRGPDAYWMLGVGMDIRHATEVRPGAFPGGEWIPALCEQWFRVPFATPFGRTPQSKGVANSCPQCTEVVRERHFSSADWDF